MLGFASPGGGMPSARVTLDVLHTGVIWGWYVTMNFWAKSVGTGAVLVGVYMARRYAGSRAFYRTWMALLGFAFINVTLLFTVLDLHQPFRFWHMFLWPHLTSAINVGAWFLTAYNALLVGMLFALWKKRESLYEALLWPTVVLAFLSTIYTAGLLGQASAREIWSTAAEVPQMVLAATLCGSASFLLVGAPSKEERASLAWVLGLSAILSLSVFIGEIVFAPQKSEEAEWIVHQLSTGQLGRLFYGGLIMAFVIPAALSLASVRVDRPAALKLAAMSSLAGLWLVKHAWLIAPQLIPLS